MQAPRLRSGRPRESNSTRPISRDPAHAAVGQRQPELGVLSPAVADRPGHALAERRPIVDVDLLQQRAQVQRLVRREAEQLAPFVAGLDHVARDVAGEGSEVRRLGRQRRLLLLLAELDDQLLGAQQVGAQGIGHDDDDAEAEQGERVRRLHAGPVQTTARPPPASMSRVRMLPTTIAAARRPRRHAVTLASAKKIISRNTPAWPIAIQGLLTPTGTRTTSPRNETSRSGLDLEPVQVFADREVDDQRHQAQADGGHRQPAPAGVEVVEGEAGQRDHQHEDRHMGPAHGGGIGLRRRRLEHDELAEGDARGGDGGERECQRRLRAAIAPPDREMDCGERQAGRGDHRPDDGDETHPARMNCHVHGAESICRL